MLFVSWALLPLPHKITGNSAICAWQQARKEPQPVVCTELGRLFYSDCHFMKIEAILLEVLSLALHVHLDEGFATPSPTDVQNSNIGQGRTGVWTYVYLNVSI